MAGGHILTAKVLRQFHQPPKLHGTVAPDAGIWGQALLIGGRKGSDNLLCEFLRQGKNMVGHSQPLGYIGGIPGIRGAGRVQLHGGTHAGKALLL